MLFIPGLALRSDPKPAGSQLVQFPQPPHCLRNMDTRKTEDVSSKKKTHKTRKTHVEMLKKENYNAKGKLRRGHHILAYQPSGAQVTRA